MHKILITHQIVPGKFDELSNGIKKLIRKERRKTLIIRSLEDTFTKPVRCSRWSPNLNLKN